MKRLFSLLLCALLICNFVLPVYAVDDVNGDNVTTVEEAGNDALSKEGSSNKTTGESTGTITGETTGTTTGVTTGTTTGETTGTTTGESTGTTTGVTTGTTTGESTGTTTGETTGTTTGETTGTTTGETTGTTTGETTGQTAGEPAGEATDGDTDEKETEFNAQEAKEYLMSLTEKDEIEGYLYSLSGDDRTSLNAVMTDADWSAIDARCGIVSEPSLPLYVDYTAVGPLMPPVAMAMMRSTFALSRSASTDDENGLILNKTASANTDGTYTITLEAYTTGNVTGGEAIPSDIILVLDESGSMAQFLYTYEETYTLNTSETYYILKDGAYQPVYYCSGVQNNGGGPGGPGGSTRVHDAGWYDAQHGGQNGHTGNRVEPMTSADDTTSGRVQFYAAKAGDTKNQALVKAAKNFVQEVYNDAQKNNLDNRIAVIGFSSNNNAKAYVSLTSDIRDNKSAVDSAIENLKSNGGTYIEDGMALAESAFDNAVPTTSTQRNRVVVIFTDGIPGSGTWNDTTISNSANPAINSSYNLKNKYGATVYTVAILDGAKPDAPIDTGSSNDARTNRFLHYLSSNYPNAQSMNDGGQGGGNNGYYLAASSSESLNEIFGKISDQVSTPSIDLGTSTVVKDIVTPQFVAPTNSSDIHVYTADYNGSDFGDRVSATGITITPAGTDNTISVSGFDFNENFVSDVAHSDGSYGKKLIIEFNVSVDPDFLGGNFVNTNASGSGVYTGNTCVEEFEIPNVDVPVKTLSMEVANQNIYLGNDANLDELLTSLDSRINGSNNSHVKIVYEIKDSQNNLIGKIEIPFGGSAPSSIAWTASDGVDLTPALKSDQTYTITATATPVPGGTYTAVTSEGASATVNVFMPVLTFKDSVAYYGDAAPDYSENLVSERWVHGSTLSSDVVMRGDKPVLGISYTVANGLITNGTIATKNDIPVNVSVKIGTESIDQYVTFEHSTCDTTDCEFNAGTEEFLIHVNTCALTVRKSGGAVDEPYVINVYKQNGNNFELYTQLTVTISVNSATIYELPVGCYMISEDESWAWRYESVSIDKASVTLSSVNDADTITCTNSSRTPEWLNDFSAVAKNIFGVANGSAN